MGKNHPYPDYKLLAQLCLITHLLLKLYIPIVDKLSLILRLSLSTPTDSFALSRTLYKLIANHALDKI